MERNGKCMDNKILIKNADCRTMESAERASWIYVEKNTIKDMGSGEGYLKYVAADVEVIDAGQKTVLPGFIDNHFHMVKSAISGDYLDLSSARNFTEMGELISLFAKEGESPIIAYRLERPAGARQEDGRRDAQGRDELPIPKHGYPVFPQNLGDSKWQKLLQKWLPTCAPLPAWDYEIGRASCRERV